jgi:MFS family permease
MTDVTLRSITPSAYVPTLLYGTGQGAIAPVVALSALDLGASTGQASLVVALAGVGQLAGDLPAGWLTARFGERATMLAASLLVASALAVCALAGSLWVLGAAIFCTGLAGAVWGLARQTYVTDVVPLHMRARALSTLGGSQRIGMFIGPFVGAGAMQVAGLDGAYWLHVGTALAAAVLLLSVRTVGAAVDSPRRPTRSIARVAAENLSVIRTLGTGVFVLGAVRASRQAVIPLWAAQIGLDATTTSLVFGISSAVDMLLFYPAGKVMDEWGRAWVAVPSLLILAVAHALLPLTAGVPSLTAVAVMMGVGNGIGSGIVMILGADVAPPDARPEFLGVWRLCFDSGNAGGPLLISLVTAAVALGPAIVSVGVLAVLGAGAMHRWIPPLPDR